VKKLLVASITIYQRYISPFKGANTCMFQPSCSEYTKQALEQYGVIQGLWLGFRRILRCHPWQKNFGPDPLPPKHFDS
jgi:putative membrane protein insertion efficiency factor